MLLTKENAKKGMKVKLIVPDGQNTSRGRCGVFCGEVGVIKRIGRAYVSVLYPNWKTTPDRPHRDWSKYVWNGNYEEFEIVTDDWWDVWGLP